MNTDSTPPEFDDRDFYTMFTGSIGGTFGVLFFGSVIGITLIQAVAVMFLLEIIAVLVSMVITPYM